MIHPIRNCWLLTTVILCLAACQMALAQTPDFSKLTGLGEVRYHQVDSRIMDHTYHLFVRLPEDYKDGEQYPTVYLLDGGATWPMLASYYQYLHYSKEVPTAIIVGISYGSIDFQSGNMRSRDFTAKTVEREYWGGAPQFQKAFAEEFFPLIEKKLCLRSATQGDIWTVVRRTVCTACCTDRSGPLSWIHLEQSGAASQSQALFGNDARRQRSSRQTALICW